MRHIAENIWVFEKSFRLFGADMGNRMTVIRSDDGSLIIHSPIELTGEIKSAVDQLGNVAYIVTPNAFHGLYAKAWVESYPDAKYYSANPLSKQDIGPVNKLAQPSESVFPAGIELIEVQGLPKVNEVVFFHASSRTLIVTDIAFNIGKDVSLWSRLFFNLNGAYNKFGPSRLMKSMVENPSTFGCSIEQILTWNFDRIIVSHGEILESDGHCVFADAFKEYLNKSANSHRGKLFGSFARCG